MVPTVANPFGLTTTPNVVAQWETLGAGAVPYAAPERAVYENADGVVGAVAFVGEDLVTAAGCVYVAMDLSYWLDVVAPKQDLSPLVENTETFLVGCDDADSDGLSGGGELEVGTDPNDPDTDDDTLCDGYGTVTGVCASGESPLFDFDNDGLVNPLDVDDEGDGLLTRWEVTAEAIAPNADDDFIPAQHDHDSDADFNLDGVEGMGDYDGDGIPAIVDQDDMATECDSDADCTFAADLYCNLDVGYCHPVPEGGVPDDTDAPSDTDAPNDTDTPGNGGEEPEATDGDANCGCSAAGPTGATLGLVALALVIPRRRRS